MGDKRDENFAPALAKGSSSRRVTDGPFLAAGKPQKLPSPQPIRSINDSAPPSPFQQERGGSLAVNPNSKGRTQSQLLGIPPESPVRSPPALRHCRRAVGKHRNHGGSPVPTGSAGARAGRWQGPAGCGRHPRCQQLRDFCSGHWPVPAGEIKPSRLQAPHRGAAADTGSSGGVGFSSTLPRCPCSVLFIFLLPRLCPDLTCVS